MKFVMPLGQVKTQGIVNTVKVSLRNPCGDASVAYFDYSVIHSPILVLKFHKTKYTYKECK